MPPVSALLFIACTLGVGALLLAQPKAKPMGASAVLAGLALCGLMVLGIALARVDSSRPVRLDLTGVTKRLAGGANFTIGTDPRTADIVVPPYRGATAGPVDEPGADDAVGGEGDHLVIVEQSAGGVAIALRPIDLGGNVRFDACFHPVGTAFDQALCARTTDGAGILRTRALAAPLDQADVEQVGIQLFRADPAPGDNVAPRYRSRRGLVLSLVPAGGTVSPLAQAPRIKASFNDPPSATIGRCPDGVSVRLAASAAANSGDDFVFPQIGGGLSGGQSATALPFDSGSCRFTDEEAGPGNRFGRDSRPELRIGGTVAAPDAQILLRGRVLEFPMPAVALYLFAAAFAALRTLAFNSDRRDGANLDGPVTLILFYLLAIRLLAALAAIHYDPTGIEPSRTVEQACVELALVPLLLAALLRIGRQDAVAQTINDLFFYALIAAALWWLGFASLSLLIGGAVLVAVAGLAPIAVIPALRIGSGATGAVVARAAAMWRALPVPLWLRVAGPWLVIGALLLLVVRISAAALGIKEALPIPGVRIALSSLVLPSMIVGCAALLARVDRTEWKGKQAPIIGIAAFWLFLGLIMIGAAAARDFGFTLVYFWPVALVGILLMVGWRKRLVLPQRQLALAVAPLPLAAIGLLLIGLAVAGWTAAMADSGSLADRLQPALLLDANMSRLLAIFAPDRIESASNTEAFQTLELVLLLDKVALGNIFGHGYLADIHLGVMHSVQLSDNMPAVHLIWPFGRAGAAAMLLLLSLFGVAVRRQIGPLGDARGTLAIAAHIAVWLLVATAVYMVLANLLLVPFTGRNIFMLSATSWGDLVEGLTLILLIALPLQWRRVADG